MNQTYYDLEEPHTSDVHLFLAKADPTLRKVLELGVGTGRCAAALLQAGYEVAGIDNDPEAIWLCSAKNPGMRLLTDDLRTARDVWPAKYFDFATLFMNTILSFLSQKDLSAVFATASHYARYAWIDVFNPHLPILPRRPQILADSTMLATRLSITPSQQIHVKKSYYRKHELVAEHSFPMALMFPREFFLQLKHHGLMIEQAWGDWDGNPFDPETSPRIIVVAKTSALH